MHVNAIDATRWRKGRENTVVFQESKVWEDENRNTSFSAAVEMQRLEFYILLCSIFLAVVITFGA